MKFNYCPVGKITGVAKVKLENLYGIYKVISHDDIIVVAWVQILILHKNISTYFVIILTKVLTIYPYSQVVVICFKKSFKSVLICLNQVRYFWRCVQIIIMAAIYFLEIEKRTLMSIIKSFQNNNYSEIYDLVKCLSK